MDIPQPANKGPGKKASSHINKQLSVSDIFARTSAYPQSRNLGTGRPKLFCTACGGYDHWRKDCPYDCHCDNCDSDSHAMHMCRAPPKPSLYPIPTACYLRLIVVVQSIGRWSAKTVPQGQQRGRSHSQPSIQWVLPETDNGNLPQHLATVHIKPMLGPKIAKKLGPQATNRGNQRQADNTNNQPQCPTQGKPNNKNNFPYRDYRYSDQPRQTRFDEEQNQRYSPRHFAPSPALSAGSDLLSHSIMQLAEMQSRSLEIFAAQQKSQIEVYQELTRSNKEKEHDTLFTSIPVFDGDRTQCEQWLDDMDQATRISGRDLRTELIKKSTGVVRQVIMMAHPDASDDDLINIIREDFSDALTMNEAREELLHMHQKPEEQMRVYVYRYGRMHQQVIRH